MNNLNDPFQKKQFADGIYFSERHPNNPQFILGKISIQPEKFNKFLLEEANKLEKDEYLRLEIQKSKKTGKPYIVVDNWKKH